MCQLTCSLIGQLRFPKWSPLEKSAATNRFIPEFKKNKSKFQNSLHSKKKKYIYKRILTLNVCLNNSEYQLIKTNPTWRTFNRY